MYKPINKRTDTVNKESHVEIIDEIVKSMWEFINRDRLDEIIISKANTLRGKTNDETIRNVFDYVKKNVPYKSDPDDRERLTAPIHFIQRNQVGGDCDDMVMLINALLESLGIKTQIKVVAWRRPEFTHVVSEAWNGNRWIELDATMINKSGYDVKFRMPQGIPKIKYKTYENPMEMKIEKLSDQVPSSSGCNSCKKRKATNENINVNIIPIGNSLTNPYEVTPKRETLPITPEQKIVKLYLDNTETLERDVKRFQTKNPVPVKAITSKGNSYIYQFGY